jgi:hypothetical protein
VQAHNSNLLPLGIVIMDYSANHENVAEAASVWVQELQKGLILMAKREKGIPFKNRMLYDLHQTTAWKDEATSARFQDFLRKKQELEKKEARESRHASRTRRAELLKMPEQHMVEVLIDRVAGLFAAGLITELRQMYNIQSSFDSSTDSWEIVGVQKQPQHLGGLFAKWTPTPGGMHDKALNISCRIRQKLLQKLNEAENAHTKDQLLQSTRTRIGEDSFPLEHVSLQRDVLTPLRTCAEVPEHFIGPGIIEGNVNYSRMASRCRLVFGEKVFRRYDQDNYDSFLVDAAKSQLRKRLKNVIIKHEPKVNVGSITPHEVVSKAVCASSPVQKVEAALQWQAIVESCKQILSNHAGKHKRLIIPMCDVSGSMEASCGGLDASCMDVACALSLLLSESLQEDNPFYGKILTFSDVPMFVDLRPEEKTPLTIEAVESAKSLVELQALIPDLALRVERLKRSDWGMNTDFFKAMESICNLAKQNNMTSNDIEGLELVVFSDMEFDEAQYGSLDKMTMLEKVQALIVKRFGPDVANFLPKIVFWNLRSSATGSGVTGNAQDDSVALLSGVSAGMIRSYLGWDMELSDEGQQKKVNPMSAMLACVEDPLYKKLRLEEDLEQWEVILSEEEIMRRGEKITGENQAWAYASNSSALVAFFFEVVPGVEPAKLEELLDAAFKENPLLALKLVFQLGCVRRKASGKSDRHNFQRALLWLWRKWPKTYMLNLENIYKFTSLKELLNSAMFILYEDESNRDSGDYSLFSLDGQKTALNNHISRKLFRDNRARREARKLRSLAQWLEFAQSEGKILEQLRVKVDWKKLKEKLVDKAWLDNKLFWQSVYLEERDREEKIYWSVEDFWHKNQAGGKATLGQKGNSRNHQHSKERKKREDGRKCRGYHRPSQKRLQRATIVNAFD